MDIDAEAKRLWAEIEEAAEDSRSFAHAIGQIAAALRAANEAGQLAMREQAAPDSRPTYEELVEGLQGLVNALDATPANNRGLLDLVPSAKQNARLLLSRLRTGEKADDR